MATNPGTPIVTKIIFPVAEMATAVEFYRRLGFEVMAYDETYAWVRHDGGELLHLSLEPDTQRNANRAAGYFHVQDVDAWHEAWTAAGVELGPVGDRPWQMREFALRDPSGNLIRIGQNL